MAHATDRPLMGPDGLENWHPRDLATLVDILDEERAARRREANRG